MSSRKETFLIIIVNSGGVYKSLLARLDPSQTGQELGPHYMA